MKNFISPNSHPSSLFSGSTLESMISKAKELNTGYYTCTDNGYLTNALKAYNHAKKQDLKPILGCEIYVTTENSNLYNGTKSNQIKYFTITLHAKNQKAYQYLAEKLSEKDRKTIKILDQEYPTFTWWDLNDFSDRDFTAVIGGPQCLVSKNLLVDEIKVALNSYKELHDMFGSNLYASIIPVEFDKKWVTSSVFTFMDGETVTLDSTIKADTNVTKNKQAFLEEVANKPGRHRTIKNIYVNGVGFKVNREIASACNHNDFKSIGIDIYKKYNDFIIAVAGRYKTPILLNDYSYYADKDDKLVQDLKLGDECRMYANHYSRSTQDVVEYFNKNYSSE